MLKIAEVLVEIKSLKLNQVWDYLIPDYLSHLKIGMKVKVPFNNRSLEGFVVKIKKETKVKDSSLKSIIEIKDQEVMLDDELLKLGKYLAEERYNSLVSVYDSMLPKTYKLGSHKKIKYLNTYYVKEEKEVKNEKQKEIVLYLKKHPGSTLKDISYSSSSLHTLIKNNIIEVKKEEVYRLNLKREEKEVSKLTSDQESVYNTLIKNKGFNTYLLYGVTGSGKTLIYLKICEYFASLDKTVILLVPEISLTVQTVNYFKNYFSFDIAILHSGLTDLERGDEYRKIRRGEVKVIIGARSAIFAPIKKGKLGAIIIDEEHSTTYTQTTNPKYDAKDVALKRCEYHNALLLLGSATPSLISFTKAYLKKYQLLKLPKRINNQKVKIHLVDLKEEKHPDHFSSLLKEKIREKLAKKEQIILLLNRKGYANFASCSNCGSVYKCPNCDISLTYYKSDNSLRCSYCGFMTYFKRVCFNCHERGMTTIGVGTEKIEEEIKTLFPLTRVIRMDMDTTKRKNEHYKLISRFSEGGADILLGTQMITKGLDFPNVTLVGIINADTSLVIPNYKASEDTFCLLQQVSGRSGRSKKAGEVVIQTYNPEHYAIRLVKQNDYLKFYQQEMNVRYNLKYPPYYYLILLKFSSYKEENVKESALQTKKYLKEHLNSETIILGPNVEKLFKLRNKYSINIILKYQKDEKIKEVLNNLQDIYKHNSSVILDITINPDFVI